MKLYELENQEIEGAYYNPEADKINKRIPSDTRKPVLTLKMLNRLKKIRALRRIENLKREDLMGVMYATPSDDGGMGGPQPY